ncbi:MAG: hypothetical protein KA052_03690 [Candidatus Pacebacteria bacterium]|nr:hypothetical protein [Candidatus Paceibacterota bacterium]
MDIFAHTLWAAVGAKGLNGALHRRASSVGWTAFLGVAPDFFAFGLTFLASLPSLFSGEGFHRSSLSGLPHELYNYSHSLVIWAAVFLLVWAIRKKPWLPLFGWALHILIDIPSHVISFYPTPFLFPLSEYRFPYGIQWSNKWYMIINYTLLAAVWIYILIRYIRKRQAVRYLNSK